MSHRRLPRPVTTQEQYLAAILAQLRGEQLDTPETDVIDLREPKASIPDDFPGRDSLVKAGFETIEQIPRDGDALVKIKGIGKATAGQILVELG